MRQSPNRGDLGGAATLALVGSRGPRSRAAIARELGVSPATVTQVTKDLVDRGLLVELETVPSTGGRPGRLLGLADGPAPRAIGAKVTADHVAIVSVGFDGSTFDQSSHPFDPASPDALDTLGRLLRETVDAQEGPVLGAGVGLPGSVDSQASGVVVAPTLGWSNVPVGASLRRALDLPVLVENDVNTLAVAEQLYGVGRDHRSFLVLTIGRGIGSGLVVDGTIRRGAAGGAGEIGHFPVHDDGPPCTCGNVGCLESFIGDDALRARAVAAGILRPGDTVADLTDRAEAGDRAARDLYHDAGRLLGRTLAGVVHLLDPEVVILLGEGIGAWKHWRSGFDAAFRAHLLPSRRAMPFVVEPWADDKWALGAAALVLATPFDAAGASGEQGRLVVARLHSDVGAEPAPTASRRA